jgi:hypothetical protein
VTGVSHLRDAAWPRDGEVARQLALLDRDGEKARIVGGAVRYVVAGSGRRDRRCFYGSSDPIAS